MIRQVTQVWWRAWVLQPSLQATMIFLLLGIIHTEGCPDKCLCPPTSNQVSCEGAGFLEIPRGLPPSISTLDLSNNNLLSLSSSALTRLRNVINLKLESNDISLIHDGTFEPMESLQTLDLSSNDLKTLTEYSLRGPSSLLHLYLSNNSLSEIDGAFSGMSDLSRLDLSDNQLTRISQFTFRDLTNLRYLNLAGNQISHIDRRAFRNLEKLSYIVLKGNSINQVPRFQFNSLSLSYVDLSECGLTRIPRGLPSSVRYLQLRRNNISLLHRHAFQDCPHVTILVLDENGIQEVQDRTFEHMTYLQQLWLNNNRLTTIPKPLPQSLERLLMDSNRLTNVTNVFPNGALLNTLSLMGNNISHLSYDALYKLSKLKSLDLSNNRIQHLYGNTFINSTELKTLQLSKNPLTYFHSRCFHGLGYLQTLSLAYVSTEVSMYWDIFMDLVRLSKLDLDSSPYVIRSIMSSDRLLAGLNGVEDLSMHSSDVTTLRADFPELFPNLLVLHISSTRWHCDTSLLWFRTWLLATEIQVDNKEDIRCFTPRAVHDRSIISLPESQFVPVMHGEATTRFSIARLTTFTTDRPSTRPTSPQPGLEGSARDSDEEEDGADSSEIDDFFHKSLPPVPGLDTRTPGVLLPPKEITWEEILSQSSEDPTDGGAGSSSSTTVLPSNGGKYTVQNDNLSLQTLPKDNPVLQPVPTPSSDPDSSKDGGTIKLIIIATTLVTFVIAAILIATIVYFSRKSKKRASSSSSPNKTKRKKSSSSSKGQGLYQNGIKYKHRNDVLYFMPASAEGSTTDSLQTNASGTKEANMALVPGRDINHEGPLRCYKWEDF